MNILIMMQLKVILVSLFLLGFLDTQKECKEEYDLINYLACGLEDETLNEDFLFWRPRYDSYERINPKNFHFKYEKEFDLDEIFDENQRRAIDDFLKSKQPSKLDLDSLKCKNKLNKTKGYVRGKTTFGYSYPIISKSFDNQLYGILLESKVFEINNTLKLKVFKKQSDSWNLIYEVTIAFS